MPSLWNRLFGRKKKTKKVSRRPKYDEHEHVDSAVFYDDYRGSDGSNTRGSSPTEIQRFPLTTDRWGFPYLPNIQKPAETLLEDERRSNKRHLDYLVNRQGAPDRRHLPYNEFPRNSYHAMNVSSPDHESESLLAQGYTPSYIQKVKNERLFETDMEHTDHTTHFDPIKQRFRPVRRESRGDFNMLLGYNTSPYHQQTDTFLQRENVNGESSERDTMQHAFKPVVRNAPGMSIEMGRRLSTSYVFGDLAFRHNIPVVYPRQTRRVVRRPENRRFEIISSYVPRAVSQEDVSAFLFGKTSEEMSPFSRKNPTFDHLPENHQFSPRYSEQTRSFKSQSLQLLPREHSIDPRFNQLRNFQQPPVENTRHPNFSCQSYTKLQDNHSDMKSDQVSCYYSTTTSSPQWDSSQISPDNMKSAASDDGFVGSMSNSGAYKTSNPYAQSANTQSSGKDIWQNKNNFIQGHGFTPINSYNTDGRRVGSKDNSVTNEEICFALSELDSVTSNASNRNIDRELEEIFDSSEEVLY